VNTTEVVEPDASDREITGHGQWQTRVRAVTDWVRAVRLDDPDGRVGVHLQRPFVTGDVRAEFVDSPGTAAWVDEEFRDQPLPGLRRSPATA